MSRRILTAEEAKIVKNGHPIPRICPNCGHRFTCFVFEMDDCPKCKGAHPAARRQLDRLESE